MTGRILPLIARVHSESPLSGRREFLYDVATAPSDGCVQEGTPKIDGCWWSRRTTGDLLLKNSGSQQKERFNSQKD
jgi:hypothetical protein